MTPDVEPSIEERLHAALNEVAESVTYDQQPAMWPVDTDTRRRTRGPRALVMAGIAVVLSVSVAIAVRSAVNDRHHVPASNTTPTTTERESAALRIAFRSAVRAAPYHVFAPTAPSLILYNAESQASRNALPPYGANVVGSEVYQVNLFYRAAHGTFHVYMATRSWLTSVLRYDIAALGTPTTISGTVWRVQTLPRGSVPTLQLARATTDGAVIEVDGPFDLHTMATLTASLR